MATSTIRAKARVRTATGTYTTAEWGAGTNTCTFTVPSTGLYLIYMKFESTDSSATARNAYKQFQMRGTASGIWQQTLYYDASGTASVVLTRTITQPISAETGQTVIPYIHTNVAGIVYNVSIIAVQIA